MHTRLLPRLYRGLGLRRVLPGVAAMLSTYLMVVLVLLALEDGFVFRPSSPAERWREADIGCTFQEVCLSTPGGDSIYARWFPCPGSRGAVLVCHSQNANLSICWPAGSMAEWRRQIGMSVLVFDYPGYSKSSGKPSETGCHAAADAAYRWLTREQGIAAADVLVVGRSLGTAVAVNLASRRPHRALVLVSPFTSIPDVAQTRYPILPARLLMRNRFDSLSKIGECRRPVLILHGTED